MSARALLFSVILFAIAGAISRYLLQDVETRIQILWFWGLAVLVNALLRRSQDSRSFWAAVIVDGAAATSTILVMRIALEGLPGPVTRALAAV